ncbi:hypothetical protein [Candidatus Methanosphaera massiliense]|jgi:hypothetical protein|uniref:hypothetical protein n=1 Tax=Methanosphaera TaxID=2316 RepID=UPI00238048A7|nr:hypothetical protein [Candidatus Methanosphaera massiliense]MDD6285138.1 hypothetical protein [Methanobacteriaceae archaeon]MDE4078351.1 hypothetical protein [Candidatus Methanosphaera massiliense]MDY2744453.1 hypothetical protein [Methanosphaera sp.]
MLFDVICFALSGFFMKISDEAMDEKNNIILAIITGILCVAFTVAISITNGDAACIFIAILIGNILAKKVDSINHIISAILLIALLIYVGVPHFSWFCLIVCIIAAYIDEWGNDKSDEREENEMIHEEDYGLLDKFFKYRYALKVAVLILSMLGLINMMIPNSPLIEGYFFEPLTFIYFYLFDLSYEFAGLYFDRIYNLF